MTDWTFHDLRRTATTHMGELRVPRHIRKLLLDHAENDVTGIYDRYEYLEERRDALEKWAAKIRQLEYALNENSFCSGRRYQARSPESSRAAPTSTGSRTRC